jgi:hypothetical protein
MSGNKYLIIAINMMDISSIDDVKTNYINTWITDDYTTALAKVKSELWKIYLGSGGDPDNSEFIDEQLEIIKEQNSVKSGDVYIEIRSV